MAYFFRSVVAAIAIAMVAAGSAQALDLRGNLVQGGLVFGQVDPGSELHLNGRPVHIGRDGHFLFGLSRDEAPTALLELRRPDGRTEEQVLSISAQTYDIERVDGLPPRTVNIPEEERQRRQRERSLVGAARASQTEALDWLGGFIRPASGRISGVYGSQRILNGEPRTPHYGLDIAAPVGEPIYAPAAGVVRLAQPDFLLEGGIVIIDHGFALFSTLFHMNSVSVTEGQRVAQGDQIGTIGAKGRASGPHVDWRINWGSVRLDPALVLED